MSGFTSIRMKKTWIIILFFLSVLLIFAVVLGAESKSSSKLDEKEFQNLVVKVLEKHFSSAKIRKGENEQIIYINKIEYSLSNLYRTYLRETKNNEETLILDHFEKAARMTENHSQSVLSWTIAKTILMPQIIRREYAKENRIFQGRTFGNNLVVSFVLNYKDGYRYVLEEDPNSWNVGEEEMFRAAVYNLDRMSGKVTILEVNSGIFAIRKYDSYDAARILLPKLRERFVKLLGNDFEFALPKRDFLICWSKSLPEDVKRRLAEQILSDYLSGSYSIAPEIFIGNVDGVRVKE